MRAAADGVPRLSLHPWRQESATEPAATAEDRILGTAWRFNLRLCFMSSRPESFPAWCRLPGMDRLPGINTTALDGIQTNLRKRRRRPTRSRLRPVERAEPTELAEPLVKSSRLSAPSRPCRRCCGAPTTRSTAYSTRCAPERVRRVRLLDAPRNHVSHGETSTRPRVTVRRSHTRGHHCSMLRDERTSGRKPRPECSRADVDPSRRVRERCGENVRVLDGERIFELPTIRAQRESLERDAYSAPTARKHTDVVQA